MIRSYLCFVILFFLGQILMAQDFSWWNRKHQWDGQTHWTHYMIMSPAFMGPNALPVPEIRKGIPTKTRSFELAMDGHFSKGDKTGNLFTELYFPLFSERVALGISYVPIEFYRTDTLTRDLRRSREFDGQGVSFGDVYFSTCIHLVQERSAIPDLLFSVNLKTASGTNFDGARHTDTPGYYFDLSAGKTMFSGEGSLKIIRAYVMAGFYVYQTNLVHYLQNDAFSYGAGVDLRLGPLQVENQLGGYVGYLDIGDKPMVYRLNLLLETDSPLDLKLRFQKGFVDYPYTSARISTIINF